MKILLAFWTAAFLAFFNLHAQAATLYVDLNSTNPVLPYASWSTAATNIQNAVDASTNGDLIVVSNGVYQTGGRMSSDGVSNRVVIPDAVMLQSVNGQAATLIDGSGVMRSVYLTNGAILSGFTVTNGDVPSGMGGGIYCASTNAIVEKCLVISNSSEWGGGVYSGTLTNCTLSGNSASYGGGTYNCDLNNCVLTNNSAVFWGGGSTFGTLNCCTLSANYSQNYGGGASHCVLNDCMVSSNKVLNGGGGGVDTSTLNRCDLYFNLSYVYGGGAYSSVLNNCLLIGNTAGNWGGGAGLCTLNNCTVVSNSAPGSYGGGAYGGNLTNCIVYYNSAPFGSNYLNGVLNFCCTVPLPTGAGNITNDPMFINLGAEDFHLQSNSFCINAGESVYVAGSTDLDGRPRIVDGKVDIGAYEFQAPFNAWLEQFGLATNGSADFIDSDDDGLNNYQEYVAGTNPTNALSVLALLPPVPTNNPAGIVVSWQSVSNRTYFLQSSTNLAAQPAFSIIQSNIVGQPDMTSFMDTNAVGNGPFFYRVGVQQ